MWKTEYTVCSTGNVSKGNATAHPWVSAQRQNYLLINFPLFTLLGARIYNKQLRRGEPRTNLPPQLTKNAFNSWRKSGNYMYQVLQNKYLVFAWRVCLYNSYFFFYPMAQLPPSGPGPPHYWDFTITLRHTTLVSTPLDEWSARRRDLYLTTHNTQNRQTSMPPGGIRTHNPSKRTAAVQRLMADSHITCRAHAAPILFPCHAVPLRV